MHKLAHIIGAHLLKAKNAESLFNSITNANKPLKKLKFQEMQIQENLDLFRVHCILIFDCINHMIFFNEMELNQ